MDWPRLLLRQTGNGNANHDGNRQYPMNVFHVRMYQNDSLASSGKARCQWGENAHVRQTIWLRNVRIGTTAAFAADESDLAYVQGRGKLVPYMG